MDTRGERAPVVLLEARGEIVPITVGRGQARSIERVRQGIATERPMTHDLFAGVLDDLDVGIDRVRIDDLADGTFYAKLDLVVHRGDERDRVVRDARPSDGIALAVRADCPVLVADSVVDEAGQPPEALGIDVADRQVDDHSGTEFDLGASPGPADAGDREERESIDLDDAVDIDIDDAEAPDVDDESEF